MALRHGTHHGAHGQAVEIVVDEDQHAQQHGQQLRTGAGLHGLLGPAAEGSGTAGLVHQIHHDAQDDQEDQDGDVDGVDHADALTGADEVHDHLPGLEVGQQQGAYHAAQEQGRVHFLTDEASAIATMGGNNAQPVATKPEPSLATLAMTSAITTIASATKYAIRVPFFSIR